MAFNETYVESIQTKHLSNVGFTSTAKGVTNESFSVKNPHQLLASQIPSIDVVTTHGIYTASGIAAGVVEEHIVELTADPTVNGNKAWLAYEADCTVHSGSGRGDTRIDQWMRYPQTEYKLRLYSATSSGTPDYSNEILPSETQFNWEYDPSAGAVYFDEDPTDNTGFTGRLWGTVYTYIGETVADGLSSASGTSHTQDTDQYLDFGGSNEVSAVDLHSDIPLPGITVSPHGFPDRFGTTLAFDDANRQFSITPTGASFDYYDLAVKYTVATSGTVQITDTEGLWYIYYEGATLTASQTEWAYSSNVPVSDVYWDATNKTAVVTADERHGVVMDPGTYEWIHKTVGARYQSGLALSYTAGAGTDNSHAQISLENGIVWDGDLDYEIIDGSPQDISPVTQAPVFYRTGANGYWRKTVPDAYPVYDAVNNGRLGYNDWSGITWDVLEVGDNGYVAVWIIATNDINYPIISCLGQRDDTSLLDAQSNNTWEGLAFGQLPFREMKVLYRVIYRTKDTFSNTVHALVEDVQDLRSVSNFPSGTYVATDHGTLTGLSDQDHPAAAIYTTTTSFSGTLSSADDDVQKSLETIDTHTHDGRYYTETEVDGLVTGLESDITTLSGFVDDNYYTQTEVDGLVTGLESDITTLSGVLSDEIDADITTFSGFVADNYYTQTEVDDGLALQDEFLELTDTIAAYTDGRMLVETGTELVDYAGLTYASGTSMFTAPNVDVTTNLDVGGDTDLTGTLGFDAGVTINGFVVTLSGTPTDDTVTTSLGTKNYVDDQIDDNVYWELIGDVITNKSDYQNVNILNNLVVQGDLLVSGTRFITSTETVEISDNLLIINNGEVGAGVTEGVAGFEVDRGTSDNYLFYFDETDDNFQIGVSGSLQAVATREDDPVDNYVAVWNESETRFDTEIALADLATDAEVLTISGGLQTQIDGKSDLGHTHTESEITDLDKYTQTEVDGFVTGLESDITTLSGFVADNYYDSTELDAGQLDNRYYTETELDAGQLDNRYYTETEVNTISGTLSDEIDADITTLSGFVADNYYDAAELDAGQLDNRYYTETEVDGLISSIDSDITTLSGFVGDNYYDKTELDAGQLDNRYYTETEVDTISGSLQTNIDEAYADAIDYSDYRSTGSFLCEDLLIYYGYPNCFNVAVHQWSNEKVARDMAQYNMVVFGNDVANTGHADYANFLIVAARLKVLKPTIKLFGYATINQSLSNFQADADEWNAVTQISGVTIDGILMDECGYDYGVTRSGLNDGIDYVHSLSCNTCFVNAWFMDHIVGVVNDSTYPNATFNPGLVASNLTDEDWYLLESYPCNTGSFSGNNGYCTMADWLARGNNATSNREEFGVKLASVSVISNTDPTATTLYDFHYHTALTFALDAQGSSDTAYGASSSRVDIHERTSWLLEEMGLTYEASPSVTVDPTNWQLHCRCTNKGQIDIDHTGIDPIITFSNNIKDIESSVGGVDVFKNVSNGVDTTTASGTDDTLVFIGANGVGITIGDDPNTVTISGAPQTSLVDTMLDWNAGGGTEYWTYGSGFTSVPSDMVVYYNGVKQRDHVDYYVASIDSGAVKVVFAFETFSSDWVNIEYSLTTNTEGLARQWIIKLAAYTAIEGDRIMLDTSAGGSNGAYTITLPANPVYGNHICFLDAGGNCTNNNVTVARNGENIQGAASDLSIDSNDASLELIYYNATRGWVIYE